jgi:hypothetical protein
MSQPLRLVDRILSAKSDASNKKYLKLELLFNPFPRSGTANINAGDVYNEKLIPVDESVTNQIVDFIRDALVENPVDSRDRFISATITGDYGSGKTQLLMFAKALLGEVATTPHKAHKNPYVIYVDSPGVKLLEFIGTIISRIGEEDFKKFLWAKIIDQIRTSHADRIILRPFQSIGGVLFPDTNPDPYADQNMVSYKQFLNSFTRYLSDTRSRREFDEKFKQIIIRVLQQETKDPVLAQYFYELVSEDYGVNKTWEALSSGSIKQLDRKVVHIIRYIVQLIKEQGYTDFFILVDEFEDITKGRLTKPQVDNYVYNLRTLIDEHREWCLLFAMTGEAMRRLRKVSPPLADRISARLIILQNLNDEQAAMIALNYLSLARGTESTDLTPFDQSGIKKLNELVEGNARRFLRGCYFLVERALVNLGKKKAIDSTFVAEYFSHDSI